MKIVLSRIVLRRYASERRMKMTGIAREYECVQKFDCFTYVYVICMFKLMEIMHISTENQTGFVGFV